MGGRSKDYRRALDFAAGAHDAYAARRTRWRWGTALWNERYPKIWDLNFARLDDLRGGRKAGAEAIAHELDEVQGALEHRKIWIPDAGTGETLRPGFEKLGWRAQTLVVMNKEKVAARTPGVEVEEVSVSDLRPSLEDYFAGVSYIQDDETRRQIVDQYDIVPRGIDVRCFAVRSQGTIASFCLLFSHGGIAQVEDVTTLEAYRNRGYASAVVLRAVAAAEASRSSLIFLLADADDWPQSMYRKLGFVERGRAYEFVKE